MKPLLIAALITLSTVAHAEKFCDATHVATITSATIQYAEVCAAGLYTVGNSTPECALTRELAQLQYQAVRGLGADGCETYINGPTNAQVRRLGELAAIFKAYRP